MLKYLSLHIWKEKIGLRRGFCKNVHRRGGSENVEVFHMGHQIVTIEPENNNFDQLFTWEAKSNLKLSSNTKKFINIL